MANAVLHNPVVKTSALTDFHGVEPHPSMPVRNRFRRVSYSCAEQIAL